MCSYLGYIIKTQTKREVNTMTNELIGKKVTIRCKASWANGEWGIIKAYDGKYYHIAIWNGEQQLIFTRREFRVDK